MCSSDLGHGEKVDSRLGVNKTRAQYRKAPPGVVVTISELGSRNFVMTTSMLRFGPLL